MIKRILVFLFSLAEDCMHLVTSKIVLVNLKKSKEGTDHFFPLFPGRTPN